MSRLPRPAWALRANGVEFARVGTIATVGTGRSDRNQASATGKYPFYVRSQTVMKKDDFEFDEEAILIPGEGGIGEIFHYVNGKYALHQRAYRIAFRDSRVNVKFAHHYFSAKFKDFILAQAVSSTVTSIRKPMIEDFLLPIPPRAVQDEVVAILDQLTELQSSLYIELSKEQEARETEYAHYRDQLMGGRVPRDSWRPLGQIGEFTRGRRFTRADVVAEGIPSIHYGEIYTHYGVAAMTSIRKVREELRPQLRFAMPGDVVIASVGETVEDVGKSVAWLGDDPVAIHDDTFGFRHSLDPKFVSYWMQTQAFHSQKTRHVASAKIKRLSSSALASIAMPVPALEEQTRIVETLDEFYPLVNELNVGLSAELAARRKQYEYYRDKLLTFEEAHA